MEKNQVSSNIIIDGQTVVCTEYIQEPQRLTPTGKISHAKTRVYTQRYRKEWELMQDFKGWLTSVPGQVTRAYCTYCKKNLHAHRLSLLKHTCTMKHQRAALMYQTHMHNNDEDDNERIIEFTQDFETINVESIKKSDGDDDENEDEDDDNDIEYDNDMEYVVERLDMEDDDQLDKKNNQVVDQDDNDSHDFSHKVEQDIEQCRKKIKLDTSQRRDTLAEAMAHVHGEYFEDNEGNEATEEVDGNEQVIHDERELTEVSITKIFKNDELDVSKAFNKQITNDLNSVKHNNDGGEEPETKLIAACQVNTPQLSIAEGQEIANSLTATPTQNKTLRLSTGKTVTLTTGKLPPGYVLSKIKGNIPSLLTSGTKMINQRTVTKVINKSNNSTPNAKSNMQVVAGPSEQTKKQSNSVQNIKFKAPCISTHVLDVSKGIPISGLQVSLYKLMDGRWTFLNESSTSSNGRCSDLVDNLKLQLTAGRYKIHFDVDKYFTVRRIETMYPFIEIVFDVKNPTGTYHIPILLSPHSYTTYRDADR